MFVNINKQKFKQNRLALNLTQAELAQELGISNVYISQIENGHKEPSRRIIKSFELLILSRKK